MQPRRPQGGFEGSPPDCPEQPWGPRLSQACSHPSLTKLTPPSRSQVETAISKLDSKITQEAGERREIKEDLGLELGMLKLSIEKSSSTSSSSNGRIRIVEEEVTSVKSRLEKVEKAAKVGNS